MSYVFVHYAWFRLECLILVREKNTWASPAASMVRDALYTYVQVAFKFQSCPNTGILSWGWMSLFVDLSNNPSGPRRDHGTVKLDQNRPHNRSGIPAQIWQTGNLPFLYENTTWAFPAASMVGEALYTFG